MLTAIHTLIYTSDPALTRAFFRDILGFPAVDAGDGWLIFALPPAELGIHPVGAGSDAPAEMAGRHQLYLMCDDIQKTVLDLRARGVEFAGPVSDQGWGLLTSIKVPGAGELGIYQPRHPTALGLTKKPTPRKPRPKPAKKKKKTAKARKQPRPRRK